MAHNNNEMIIIPSPLKKRAFILHEGEEYQILKYLKTTGHNGLIYRARNTRTKHVLNITRPFEIQHEGEEAKDNFFQILDLNEDEKEVTLKSFATGNERRMKVRWDEDVEFIKDGLMEEDKDLFCTLGSIMGKEVIGDFKFIPKDPHMMGMPELVMDVIFSKLTTEDLLSCRMVTQGWAKLLPIKKFVTCLELSLGSQIKATFHRLDIPNHPFVENSLEGGSTSVTRERERSPWITQSKDKELSFVKPQASLNTVYPLIQACLLEGVEDLKILGESRTEHFLSYILRRCYKITNISFHGTIEETGRLDRDWVFAKALIARNKGQLKGLNFLVNIKQLDLLDLKTGECPSLQGLTLDLSPEYSVLRNLQSLPPTLTLLSLLDLAVPLTRSEVLWIVENLPQLEETVLEVAHNHGDGDYEDDDYDEDEVDEDTISELMTTGSTLRIVSLRLGPCTKGSMDECCEKAKQLQNHDFRFFECKLDTRASIDLSEGGGVWNAEVIHFLHQYRYY